MIKKCNVSASASLFLVLLLGAFLFSGCAPKNDTDVVHDIPPVRQVSSEQASLLASLKGQSPQEIKAAIEEEWPTLSSEIIAYVRTAKEIGNHEEINITYLYGSSSAKGEDATGEIHDGRFDDQLVAKLEIKERKESIYIAVLCMNGLFDIKEDNLTRVGDAATTFTIEKGRNLVYHVGYEQAILLADYFDLPIIRGKGSNAEVITASKALVTDTDYYQVAVIVYPGDTFNLGNMTYTTAR